MMSYRYRWERRAVLWAGALMVLASPLRAADAPATAPASAAIDLQSLILTPAPAATPKINGPSVFGVRPGKPFLYTIPATGERPMTFAAKDLPSGLWLDAATGQITGSIEAAGTYSVTLQATNRLGAGDRAFRIVAGDNIELTPAMGWNSYNVWGSEITQDRELRAAKAMVSTGLINHGWTYVNMDDGWQSKRGGEFKALQPDARRFGDIKALSDQIHQMGLKFGLYSSPWVMTYAGRLGESAENPDGTAQRWPPNVPKNKKQLPFAIGKYHFTSVDAKQFAAWGVDYLKYDWGPVEFPETKEMYDALREQNRDIVFSLSNNHIGNLFAGIADVSTVANSWRTTTDITDNWGRVSNDIGFNQDKWAAFAKPGRYNDPDMLVVGVVGWGQRQHSSKLTPDEQYTHISLWCLLSAPLLMGCDLERLDPFTLNLLSNDEVLAIDQDAMVKQAVRVSKEGQLEVYRKELEDGSLGVGIFNRGTTEASGAAMWKDLGISGPHAVRDLWRQKDLGMFRDQFEATVHPHGVVLVKITPSAH